VIANDVDSGTYGEYRFGAGQKARCVVGVFPERASGCCIYEERFFAAGRAPAWRSATSGFSREARVRMRQRGCLETVASRLAIAAEAAAAAYRGEAPHLLEMAGTDLSSIKSGVLAKAVAADAVVERIVRNAAQHLGGAIAGVVNLLAPDVVRARRRLVESWALCF